MKAKYNKRKDGRYATNVWDGTYKDGKKNYVTLYGNSSAELEKKVVQLEVQMATGGICISTDIRLQDYARKWLKSTKTVREKATYNSYERIVEKCLGDLAMLRVADIKHIDIQEQVNELSNHPRTCQLFMLTIKQIFNSAVKDKIIPKGYDTLDNIAMPSYKAKERRILTEKEKEILKDYVFGDKPLFSPIERCFLAILYSSGLRREEILALTVFDVKDDIVVNKAIGYDDNTPYLKDTKSERGTRTVPVSEQCKQIISEYVATLDNTLLFSGERSTGLYMSKASYNKFWSHIREKMVSKIKDKFPDWEEIGIKDLSAHIFRHNFCTMLCYESLKSGAISTKKIAQMLGDTEEMVLKVYGHILEEQEKPEEAVKNALAL